MRELYALARRTTHRVDRLANLSGRLRYIYFKPQAMSRRIRPFACLLGFWRAASGLCESNRLLRGFIREGSL